MNRATIAASVTLGQLQQKLHTIANNLANANTTGFKRREATFNDLLVQRVNHLPLTNETGRLTPEQIRVGHGAGIAATTLRTEQGAIRETDRMLDLALTEPGYYFQIETDEGIQYTRDGTFYVTPSDTPGLLDLVASDGSPVLGVAGPLQIPSHYEDITITPNGVVTVLLPNQETMTTGQLELVHVHRPQLLEAVGANRFTAPDPQTTNIELANVLQVANAPVVKQRALEASNVNIGHEMTQLIEMQRHYQLNARSISIADEMMGLVNRLR